MENREIAEKIYNHLNEKGAGLGNVSVILIESVLNEVLPQADVIKSVCVCSKPNVNSDEEGFLFCDKCGLDVEQTVL